MGILIGGLLVALGVAWVACGAKAIIIGIAAITAVFGVKKTKG